MAAHTRGHACSAPCWPGLPGTGGGRTRPSRRKSQVCNIAKLSPAQFPTGLSSLNYLAFTVHYGCLKASFLGQSSFLGSLNW